MLIEDGLRSKPTWSIEETGLQKELRKRFEKTHRSSHELDTIIGLKYKQKKGWSLSDLFNIKQRNKEVEEEKKQGI